MGITAGFIIKLLRTGFPLFPKLLTVFKYSEQEISKLPLSHDHTSDPTRSGTTSKPQQAQPNANPHPQNGLEPKIPRDKKNRVLQGSRSPQDPRTETTIIAEFNHLTHLHSDTTRAQAPRPQKPQPPQKGSGFPSPMTHSPKQSRKRNPKAKPHPESPTMTPECIKSPMQDQETETSQISTAQNNRMLPGIAPSEKQHPPIPI